MTTLAIDTSTSTGSVALYRQSDGATDAASAGAASSELLFSRAFSAERSHTVTLFAILEEVLANYPAPDRIVIGLGPGSYAGVRISIAAAMGLQFARGCDLLGIPSVAALPCASPAYIAIGDARRETYYWTRVENGVCTEGPLLITAAELTARLAANDALAAIAPAVPAHTSAEFTDEAALPLKPVGDASASASGEDFAAAAPAASSLPVIATAPVDLAPHAQIVLPDATLLARIASIPGAITVTVNGSATTAAYPGRDPLQSRGTLEPIYLREPHITLPKKR